MSVASRSKALVPDYPDVAWSLNNIGVVLRKQGDPRDARKMLRVCSENVSSEAWPRPPTPELWRIIRTHSVRIDITCCLCVNASHKIGIL
ncbi:MAG: tetratricopeptide repeat protein [Methanothrix sp.]